MCAGTPEAYEQLCPSHPVVALEHGSHTNSCAQAASGRPWYTVASRCAQAVPCQYWDTAGVQTGLIGTLRLEMSLFSKFSKCSPLAPSLPPESVVKAGD